MLLQLEVITESGFHLFKALSLISGVNLTEVLVIKNHKQDISEK